MSNLTQVANENINAESTSINFTKAQSLGEKLELGNPVFWLSGSFLTLFVVLAFTNTSALSELVNIGFSYSTQW
ncbi:BCCT family transporter, partial [Vibrio fortis]